MRGRSYYTHNEMAYAQRARAVRAGGYAEVDWWPGMDAVDDYGDDEGEWVVSWDVPDDRLHELLGVDAAERMLRAHRELAERGLEGAA